jgi:hypothetical protein
MGRTDCLERELVLLKKEMEMLKADLSRGTQLLNQKNSELSRMAAKAGIIDESEKEKQMQFAAVSREYTSVREEIGAITKGSGEEEVENRSVSADSME